MTLTALVLMISMQGCKKDFLDINDNPNNPEDVDMQFILPSAQAAVAYTVGNQLHIVGGIWSQYWTQGPNANQYNEYEQYFWNNTESDRPWLYLYAGAMRDLRALREKATAENNQNYLAVAEIMQAYTLHIITDAWGNAPYTEALRGFEGNTTPDYDSQESLYNEMIILLDDAIAKIDFDAVDGPGADDLIYHGDMFLWYKFANTLKLKIYLRQVNVRPSVAADGIAALGSDPAEFLEPGEDALAYYIEQKFRQNPLYTTVEALNFAKNIFASSTSVNYLLSINDPRIDDFYNTNNSGLFQGIPQGAGRDPNQFPPPVDDGNFSEFDDEQIIAPAVPVRLITASESMFLQAEAIARGLMAGDAQATYEAAIEDSWNQWANAGSVADTIANYLAQPAVAYPGGGSVEEQVEAIITQKWVSMNGNQNFEAWTEWRRTGYPDFLVVSAVAQGSDFPARLLYPSDELTTNPNVLDEVTSLFTKMWWDTN